MKAVILLLVLFLVSAMKNVFSSVGKLNCLQIYYDYCMNMGVRQEECEERLRTCLNHNKEVSEGKYRKKQ